MDRDGRLLEEHKPQREKVIESDTAFVMSYLLQEVVKYGTGWRARALGRPVGGKTGTTNDQKDAWFVGFSPSMTAGVWVDLTTNESSARWRPEHGRRRPSGWTSLLRFSRLSRPRPLWSREGSFRKDQRQNGVPRQARRRHRGLRGFQGRNRTHQDC